MAVGVKIVAQNKKARHDYFIEDKYEAGIALAGTEVKSIRMGKVNIFNRDPLRTRKLLKHKREIAKLLGKTAQQGYSLIPLSFYLKAGKVKVEIGLAKGKKLYDKRQDLKAKAIQRDMERG